MAIKVDETELLPPIQWLTEEEANAYFDESAREMLGMSGEEFIRRWNAGEWAGIADTPEHRDKLYLAMLVGLA
ncbi:MAG TPA: hypothetical protein VFL82_05325 [Thermomicrobiales bacterium]|jgi:hypothetical protein|nr:hypothetical protein [Thermomicrobiales bacterium]